MPRQDYYFDGGRWASPFGFIAPGVFPGSGSDRDNLVIGDYLPGETTTGIPAGTVLRSGSIHPNLPYNDPSVNRVILTGAAGYTYIVEDAIIYGDIKPANNLAAHWIFRRCKIVGGGDIPGSISALVDCDVSRPGSTDTSLTQNDVGRVTVEDCELQPRAKKLNRDGFRGHKFTARRNQVHDTIDGFAPLITSAKGQYCNVIIEGNWTYNRLYFYPDYRNGVDGQAWQSDGTHNDGLQAQGGANLWIDGNFFDNSTVEMGDGSLTNPDKPWLIPAGQANGAALIIQNNTGVQQFTPSNTFIRRNWFKNGLCHLNVKANVGFTYTGNRHFIEAATHTTSPRFGPYWIRFQNIATNNIPGLYVNGTYQNATNVWWNGSDAGSPLLRGNKLGIYDDTTMS